VGEALAVFVDRDGVVNELVPDSTTGRPESPLRPEAVLLVPGAAEALGILRSAGYLIACVTNQPAAAKGVVPVDQILSVHARVTELLAEAGVQFDAVRMCLHHPDGVVADLAVSCCCRKPRPGMLLSAASELGVELSRSWMIGDTDADVVAGQAAGCRTVIVETPGSTHKRDGRAVPRARAADLASAVSIVVGTREKD
jgi:D-glycero-D-manno-heptose 1,7-bisphosphate phosphatase